ncbi:MAG: type I-C CRISPR-associated protein Cas7/Csd2, partial [Oscillospiraceae bacterium]
GNGDPLNGNRPRTDYNGLGEISDVCLKRKIRNRMQDMGHDIFVQSDDRTTDEFTSLSRRADATLGKIKEKEEYARTACEKWLDVRSFGQVFAFKPGKGKEDSGVSVSVRGPVSIHQATSLSPVEIDSMQITKSVSNEPGEKRGSDTMGTKHLVRFGLYKIKGSINVQLAQKTGFTGADAETIKECLRSLFENDASAARPDGSMEVITLYWWQHNSAAGQYSSAKVHRLLSATLKDGVAAPAGIEDYNISLGELPGLHCEIIDGI